MAAPDRQPLWYTFGNHMHWVDMEWLWGAEVLPGSVRDMLRFCREAGVAGNVNFDGVGYERMAAHHPAALAELRAAVAAGTVEVVGASYGQPYGLFQGGESNVRQRVYGVRAVQRLLGVRPRAFWEEEFDFFPQLPQLLRGCGYRSACLFFQWTWHTPELPREACSLIEWEGIDGSRLPTLPRNPLNLHQWPEDFEAVLADAAATPMTAPALVQWLELMPSPDWMCRSELLLPKLRELAADPRFELRPRALSALTAELAAEHAAAGQAPPVRRYRLDDTWHGMSLGKNGDAVPRASRAAEGELLAAESLSALASLLGRPYPNWDVHPAWELEEAWRELLTAQHHDNHECEGLCGFVGHEQFRRAAAMARQVHQRTARHLAWRAGGGARRLVHNRFGWTRDVVVQAGSGAPRVVPGVPAFGCRVVDPDDPRELLAGPAEGSLEERALAVRRPDAEVEIGRGDGSCRFRHALFPDGVLAADGLGLSAASVQGPLRSERPRSWLGSARGVGLGWQHGAERGDVATHWLDLDLHPVHPALRVSPGIDLSLLASGQEPFRLASGLGGGLRLRIEPAFAIGRLRRDSPFAVHDAEPSGPWPRKYPSGDWMTSEQWFEEVEGAFTGLHFIDLIEEGGARGLLIAHDGSQQFFRAGAGVSVQLLTRDPWDQSEAGTAFQGSLWLLPHGPIEGAEAYRLARELAEPPSPAAGEARGHMTHGPPPAGGLPADIAGPVLRGAPGVVATAFHREAAAAGSGLPAWAGHGMEAPFVMRFVEYDGDAAEAELLLPGEVASAWRTDLLGERCEELPVSPGRPPDGSEAGQWSAVPLRFRPREVVTVMADLVAGRKQDRDLDARREVWAQVHRRSGGPVEDGAESAEEGAE